MYFNLIIGVIVLGALYFLGKEIAGRLRSPRSILQEELEERRKRNERVQENLQRLRQRAISKMVPVRQAINDMNASLMESQRFTLEGVEDSVVLRQNGVTITVTYQLASFSVDGTPRELRDDVAQYERYVIEVQHVAEDRFHTREAVTSEEAIRLLAREIAVLLQR
jgi:hypothetical protein